MIITPRRAVMSALFGLPRARKQAPAAIPDWKAMQRLGPVAKPGPARKPHPKRERTAAEQRARRLSTRSSRRRAARKAARAVPR